MNHRRTPQSNTQLGLALVLPRMTELTERDAEELRRALAELLLQAARDNSRGEEADDEPEDHR